MGKRKREKIKLKRKKNSFKERILAIPTEKPKKDDYISLDNQLIILNSEYGHIYAYLEAVHGFLCLPDSAVDFSCKERCKEIIPMLDEAFKILDPRFREARGLYNYFYGNISNKAWPEKLKILGKRCEEKGLEDIKEDMVSLRKIVVKIAEIFPMDDIQNIECSIIENEALNHSQLLLYASYYMLEQEIDRYHRNPTKYGLDPAMFEKVS